MHQSQVNVLPKRSAKMIDGTEKPQIPLKFAKRAVGAQDKDLGAVSQTNLTRVSFVCGAG